MWRALQVEGKKYNSEFSDQVYELMLCRWLGEGLGFWLGNIICIK